MMMVALYLRPWVQYMEKEFGVTASVIADDMLIIAHGANHIKQIEDALNATHKYLEDIGSIIALRRAPFLQMISKQSNITASISGPTSRTILLWLPILET